MKFTCPYFDWVWGVNEEAKDDVHFLTGEGIMSCNIILELRQIRATSISCPM